MVATSQETSPSMSGLLDRTMQLESVEEASLPKLFDETLRGGDHALAEEILQIGIERFPDNATLRRLLAQLLNAQGRRLEASDQIRELIRLRDFSFHELLSLVDLSSPFLLVNFESIDGTGPESLFGLGNARYLHIAKGAGLSEVLAVLDQVNVKHGNHPAVIAFTGRLLADNRKWDDLQSWFDALPSDEAKLNKILLQPEYWHAMGLWQLHLGQHREAVRAFGESLRRDPTQRASLRLMISTLESHDDNQHIAGLRSWLSELDQVFRIAKDADAAQAAWIADRFQAWLRPWESIGWSTTSAQLSGRIQVLASELNNQRTKLLQWEAKATIDQIADLRLLRSLGFSIFDYPIPSYHSESQSIQNTTPSVVKSKFRLQDVAPQFSIHTRHTSDYPSDGREFYLHQANGGGLACIDYDLDGRIDFYVCQAGGDPVTPMSSRANQLFRQLDCDTIQDVTDVSSSGDRSYAQGVCAGDVNQDGLPDLVIANIGVNTLYVNQGDGTFEFKELRLGATDSRAENGITWTSSIALADLDGDGLPELIEANYISDPTIFDTVCVDPFYNCQPQAFSSEPDRVFRLQQNGVFEQWTSVCEAMAMNPKLGFGIVIANFDDQYGNDIFIANDGDLNHLWTTQHSEDTLQADRSKSMEMREIASLAGCAIGYGGTSQACMGVASGDFNRDGKLDLHVTNFYREPVNLFIQTAPGFFSDDAIKYGLHTASLEVLGFGTQAADFDNDGWLDLAVQNGHIYNSTLGPPFKMLPQLFMGSPMGFSAVDASTLGPYWLRPQLGRTLAMLDWNRDGRVDLIANSLDHDVALLINHPDTELHSADRKPTEPNHWLDIQLVGIQSEREAIGAKVEVYAAGSDNVEQTWTAWQIGGDGLMCTNEPVVHFGLGPNRDIRKVQVYWPNGDVQVFDDLKTETKYLIMQNESDAFEYLRHF